MSVPENAVRDYDGVKAAQAHMVDLYNNGTPFYTKALLAEIVERFDRYQAMLPADKIIVVTDIIGRDVRLIVVKPKVSQDAGQPVR